MKPRYLMTGLVTAVVAAASLVVSMSAEAETGGIDWKPCAADDQTQCASIEVPLDWSDPDGEKIDIGLARQPATDPQSRIGTILMNPGGPGGSGVDKVASGLPVTSEETAKRFDVVGFDPRGVNTSTPVKCDAALEKKVGEFPVPADEREFGELARLNGELAQDCRERTGPLFDHVDNLSVVHDMDAIRAALGEKKLTFLGYSYGTLMGQQYAELYGDRIRAMVLDANMDHSLATTADYMDAATSAFEQNFLDFAKWCGEQTDCALHDRDALAVYEGLRESAKRGDLTDPGNGEPIGFHALSDIAFAANNPEIWGALAKRLAGLRDGETVAPRDLAAAKETNAPFQPMWCQDWNYPVEDFADWQSLTETTAKRNPHVEWSPYNRNVLSCVGYPGEVTNPQRPLDIRDAPPLLTVGTRHDAFTPYRWSQTATEQSGATLLTYEGYGHTAYGFAKGSDCVQDVVDAYLAELEVPAEGASCPGAGDSAKSGRDNGSPGPF